MYPSPIVARVVAVAAALVVTLAVAQAADAATYPDWSGQWDTINPRFGGQIIKYDPTRPWGPAQQAPLTPEYQKVLAESMADQARGGLGNYPSARCLPGGMPHMMAIPTQEYVVTPRTTYILLSSGDFRRIFTDGRDWPAAIEPTYEGYSIGRWSDAGGEGRYDTLEVETRGPFLGPRAFDASGLPLAFDNASIFRERFHLDRSDANLLHDEITTIDHALTRPWSVDKTFHRNGKPYPGWARTPCIEGSHQIVIGKENYFLSGEGLLMPAKKDQVAPDLRYFKGGPK
jgi:hypothetical protein